MTLTESPVGARASADPEVPWPLTTFKRRPAQWIINKIMLLVALVVFTYLGIQIMAGFYYLTTQVWEPANRTWHDLVPNDGLRHDIRDVGQGLYGGLLAQQLIWNHYRRRKPLNPLDRLEIFLHIPNIKDQRRSTIAIFVIPVMVLVYALPGFFIGRALIGELGDNLDSVSTSIANAHVNLVPIIDPVVEQIKFALTQDWPQKLIGFVSAYFWGRRPAKGAFDDVQLWFAERRVAKKHPIHWYHRWLMSPTYLARYTEAHQKGVALAKSHQRAWITVLMRVAVGVNLALAAFGWYVLNYIAK